MGTKLDAALGYVTKLNLAVLPLHTITAQGGCSCGNPYCTSPGKHPRTKNGSSDASRDPGKIRQWWEMQWPDANIGVATGRENGIIVIDVDIDKGGDEGLALLFEQYGELPETWEQLTGSGGRHLVFKHPDCLIKNSASALAPGVDVRGAGGYIVAAPSNHVSGGSYVWEVCHLPSETELCELPAEWITAINAREARSGGVELKETLAEGERNTALYKYGCSLRSREEFDEAGILAALLALNATKCKPPLPEKEVRTIAGSVATLPAGRSAGYAKKVAANEEEFEPILESALADPTPDTVFTPQVIGALAALKQADELRYRRTKNQLRGKGIGARDIETSVAGHIRKNKKSAQSGNARTLVSILGDFPQKNVLLPYGYNLSADGVFRPTDDGVECACSVPVSLSRRLRNIESNEEKIELLYRRDGRWKNIKTKRSTAFSTNKVVELSNAGLPVSSETARNIVRFFDAQEAANLETLPVVRTVTHLGWIDTKRFLPGFGGDVELDFDDTGGEASIAEGYVVRGTLDKWRTEIGDFVREFTIPRFQLAAGFAAPLMQIVGERPFLLYNWAPSGYGKTAGALAAISVWGDPRTLMTTFNSTLVGLEWTAALYSDLPILIDERQTVEQGDRGDEKLKGILYMLGEGKSKSRGRKGGGLAKGNIWRSLALGTGENALLPPSAPSGAKNRVLEIYAKPFPDNVKEEAGKLHSVTSTLCGTAGQAFVKELLNFPREQVKALVDGLISELTVEFPSHSAPHIREVALLCAADALAGRWVFGADGQTAITEAYNLGCDILTLVPVETSGSDAERAMEYFQSWFGSNRAMFEADPPGGRRYGYIEPDEIQVYPTVFDAAMRDGRLDPQRVKRDWAERGWIETAEESGKVRLTVLRRHAEGRIRLVVIKKEENEQVAF